MPLNKNIKKVLVIGSGPIVIGQGAEFDYSGTQACQVLKEEGIKVILVNSNPATIMTDKEIADKVYIEPLTLDFLERVIEKERPDSLIAGMGGQIGLNLAVDLHDKGILEKYDVKVIGTSIKSIKEGEDRELFKKKMNEINEPVITSEIVRDMESGLDFVKKIGYPVIVRPAYTLGGTGGGIAENEKELRNILLSGLQLSNIGQVLLEKSVKGWKEIEYEVMRDSYGNCITVCDMENIDPVGIHTGDSIVVAPSQSLSNKEYQILRKAAINIIKAVKIEGGCNIQFALNPNSLEYAVIEINPRVSRSSALASKATGFPIAKIATKIALGYGLNEIKNTVNKKTYDSFEAKLNYVVIKIPRWPFDKFFEANKILGTKMKATGEVMAIGANLESALLKGIRGLEIGKYSLEDEKFKKMSMEDLKKNVREPDDERLFALAEIIRRDYKIESIEKITGIDIFFLKKIKGIVNEERKLKASKIYDLNKEWLLNLKKKGFSDKAIADMLKVNPNDIYKLRNLWNIKPAYKIVNIWGGELENLSPYYYSTYERDDEVKVSENKKVIVIGSGPIRIGQGIEFDYASVHCIMTLKKMGIETIIVNNNPETVSTDFNISDKLYFEALTKEDVLNIIEKEKPLGVILQFGGQTAIKLANFLKEKEIKILGTTAKQIDMAEDREKFEKLLEKLDIKRPKGKAVWTLEEGIKEGRRLGFPVLVRPSYVLGGQGMEITQDEKELIYYLKNAFMKDKKNPILIDKYLMGREIEVDAIFDGENILIPGIMEHLEVAGIHSGDSITMYPSQNISDGIKEKVLNYSKRLALEIGIRGMINIQFIEFEGSLYVIEVNPRASRTVPYISKVSGVPIVDLATKVMLGEKLIDLGYGIDIYKEPKIVAVKVPVFSTQKLQGVEVALGPEMKSTGEVLGIGKSIKEALYKGFLGAGIYPKMEKKKILVTINKEDKSKFLPIAKDLIKVGYKFIATKDTCSLLRKEDIDVEEVRKLNEEEPNILNIIKNKEVDFVINTLNKGNDHEENGFLIRRTAIERNIEVITSLDTLRAIIDVKLSKIDTGNLEIFNIVEI